MNPKRFTAFGVAVTIVGASLEAGDQEWCKPACDWIAEQPHVPHEPHEQMPTRPALEFTTSASSSANVPFIPYDDSANQIVLRNHHERRAAWTRMGSMSSSSLFHLD